MLTSKNLISRQGWAMIWLVIWCYSTGVYKEESRAPFLQNCTVTFRVSFRHLASHGHLISQMSKFFQFVASYVISRQMKKVNSILQIRILQATLPLILYNLRGSIEMTGTEVRAKHDAHSSWNCSLQSLPPSSLCCYFVIHPPWGQYHENRPK